MASEEPWLLGVYSRLFGRRIGACRHGDLFGRRGGLWRELKPVIGAADLARICTALAHRLSEVVAHGTEATTRTLDVADADNAAHGHAGHDEKENDECR